MKHLFINAAAILISTAAIVPTQAMAQVSINFNIGTAPPPPRYEAAPSPRSGYIWAPGYWNWDGHRHVWSDGHWERDRSGYVYESPEWHQHNGQWQLNKGGWKSGMNKNGHHCPPGQAKKGNC
jgi:hypothetical protein